MASAGTVRVEVTYCGAGASAGTVEVKGIANNVWTSPASVKFDISVVSATDGHLVARLGDSDPNLPPQSAHQWDGVGAAATPPPYECRIENLRA